MLTTSQSLLSDIFYDVQVTGVKTDREKTPKIPITDQEWRTWNGGPQE